ncbi:MAG: YfiR family protein [Sphingobacteriales bacterium JAD_PAG50586_3]|nr:MAG: YfiR family protein [Sphingobacteriales bacterium JAD_PAG50586_3]
MAFGKIKSILKNCTCVRYGLILFAFLMVLLSPARLNAQQDMDYTFYPKYIYHFTKYIDWPTNKKAGDFVIAIVGESNATKAIKQFFVGKKVGNQNIVIKYMHSDADFAGVHLVFVSSKSSSQLGAISAKVALAKALLVSEKEGFARKGADISFFIKDEKLKFEINKSIIENKGLKIATDLLKLAVVI